MKKEKLKCKNCRWNIGRKKDEPATDKVLQYIANLCRNSRLSLRQDAVDEFDNAVKGK
jgi:hypothetical protein